MRSTSACLALLLAFATTGCGQHGFPPPERINLSAPATVPMEFIAGRLVVSAKINGRGPYKFILDSGAQVSLLAAPFGQELGLPVSGEMPVGSPGSTTPRSGRILQVDRLEIGTLAAEKFSLLEMDLTSLQQRVPGLKGVISAHLFTGILITYDYPAAVMRYRRGELPAADGQTVFAWPAGHRLPGVLMHFGKDEVWVDVDTGSQGGLTLAQSTVGGFEWSEPPVRDEPIRLVDRELAASKGRYKGAVTFGSFRLEHPMIKIHEGSFNNVGYQVLKDFVLTIDSANRRIELRKPCPLGQDQTKGPCLDS